MNILLGDSAACGAIKNPWQSPAERKDYYASVNLSTIIHRRHRGKSPRKGRSYVIRASVWTAVREKDGFSSRSFQKVHSCECTLQDWSEARLLGVFDAMDEALLVEFSWLLIAVSGKAKKHGIALFQFTQNGLLFVDVFTVCDVPLQAVALRGPVVLYCTSSTVGLAGRNGDIPLNSSFKPLSSTQSLTRYLICSTDHDLRGAVAVLERQENSFECVTIRALHASGNNEREWVIRDVRNDNVRLIAISIRQEIAVLAEANGTLKGYDLNSGKQLWKACRREELHNSSSLLFHKDMVVVTFGSSAAVWVVRLASAADVSGHARSVTLAFPAQCTTVSSQSHGHFLAPWRDYVLLCNDVDGTHCADFDFSAKDSAVDSNQFQGAHYAFTVSKNLEKRLNAGVERVMDAAERQEILLRMLSHVRSLLVQATGKMANVQRPQLFNEQLENVLSLPDRREPMRDIDEEEDGFAQLPTPCDSSMEEKGAAALTPPKVFVNGCAHDHDGAYFAKLISSKTGMDQSARFIIVRVHLSVLRVIEDYTSSTARTLQLNVDFDRCMSAIWDVERKTGLRPGDECWLGACAPISALVTNYASSLSNLSVIVRVEADGYGSQTLGRFSLNCILSTKLNLKDLPKGESGLLWFERRVYAVAQGRLAHELHRLADRKDIAKELGIETRENLACFNFSVTSITELALAIAKLRAFIGDDVRLRRTHELSRNALREADLSLRALEREMQAMREIAARPNAVGYDVHEIQGLLRIQMVVDDAMGVVEEQCLGT